MKKYRIIFFVLTVSIFAPLHTSIATVDSGIYIGPYIQRVTSHASTILIRTNDSEQLVLHYRKMAKKWKHVSDTSSKTIHRYRINQLKRGTQYEYYFTDANNNVITRTYSFQTQKNIKTSDPLRIGVLGDSGVLTTDALKVANQIQQWDPEILLHTGDTAYDSGTEQEFADKFFAVLQPILAEVPFYGAIGNHDYTTNEAGPYKELFELPQKNSGNEDYYSFDYDGIHLVGLNTNLDYSSDSALYQWLESDLSSHSTAKWRIVYFHQPPYSSGAHGSTIDMEDTLVPLFEDYNVQLVLNGHDHAYERSKHNGIYYIVTGGGGNSLYDQINNNPYSQVFESVYHFVGLTITDNKIVLRAIDENGFVFDRITIQQ